MQKFLAELLEWYCGEIGGEVFFSALACGAGEPGYAAKWQKLAQLERCVAGRLRRRSKRVASRSLPPLRTCNAV